MSDEEPVPAPKPEATLVGRGGLTAETIVLRAKRVVLKHVLDPEAADRLVKKWAVKRPDLAEAPRRLRAFAEHAAPKDPITTKKDIVPTRDDFERYLARPEPHRRGRRPRKSG